MSFALKTLEKIKESVDNLGSLVRGLMEAAEKSTTTEAVVEETETEEVKTETEEKIVSRKPKIRKTGINRSDLVREYFREHGMEVKNKDVVANLEKAHNVKFEPSLVSGIRGKIQKGKKSEGKGRKPKKESKTKVKAKSKFGNKDLKGLPMPALCTEILRKSGREGLKWKEIAELVQKSGYEYKGNKGFLGIAQNVYQALHGLSQKKAHPGYSGDVAVVIHDEPSKRWRLNPKATKSRKIA